MPTTATVSGSIVISGISIPIESAIPPANPGELVFKYDLASGQPPTNILTVGDFTSWAASQLGAPSNFGLPTSLTALSVGVSHLLIDTAGKFQIGVLFGTDTGGTWVASWKPIDALPFSFDNLLLEIDYGSTTPSQPVSLQLSAAAAKGDTSLTFAATTGVTSGMTVSGSGIAAGTTAGAVTTTTVALSTGTSGAMAVGQTITFTPAS